MKISGSVYAWSGLTPAGAARQLDLLGVDYFHIDCIDDPSVFEDVDDIRRISDTPFDLHLITDKPEEYFDHLRSGVFDICCIQYENLTRPLEIPDDIKCRFGMAITMDTPIEVFDDYADRFAFMLFMTTTPGQSGGAFNNAVFRKIREFKQRYPSKSIHVDGGVNDEISFVLRSLGVRVVVVGSFLSKADSIVRSTLSIRGCEEISSTHQISDFMLFPNEFPVIKGNGLCPEALLEAMNEKRMGVAVVVDDHYHLQGLVTDGDVRRGLLSSLKAKQPFTINGMVNEQPLAVSRQDTVEATLDRVRERETPVMFIPVLDGGGKLEGLVSFLELIKGEL